MNRIKNFLSRFIHEEDGAEMIEWAIVIAIACVIAVPVMALALSGEKKIEEAQGLLEDINPQGYSENNGSSGTITNGSNVGSNIEQ